VVVKLLGTDFAKLWGAVSFSVIGSQITLLALPLIAAVTLAATPLQMGLLAGLGQAPFLLFSLPAGALVDRIPRRPVLIATDVGSALLLLSIPMATIFGRPSYVQLCVVAFGLGSFEVISHVAHYAYVPGLVGRMDLTRFNARLQISYSAAEAGGPGLAGVLIQALSAPIAVILDAFSFLCSALLLRSIHKREAPVGVEGEPPGLMSAVRDGLRMLFGHRVLRPLILIGSPISFFNSGVVALYILYVVRELGLSALVIGLIFAAGGVAAIPGAIVAERSGARFGVGRTIIGGYALAGLASLVVPLAAGPTVVIVAILALAKAFGGITDTVGNIHQWTLRQALTPDRLAGRVTAGHRFIVYGSAAVGALASGGLGSVIGVRGALLVFAIGMMVSPLLAGSSALADVRTQPADIDDASPRTNDEDLIGA
jgi:MFS family permease